MGLQWDPVIGRSVGRLIVISVNTVLTLSMSSTQLVTFRFQLKLVNTAP